MQRALQEGRFAHLQSQINPHFLFNTLSTIAALSREEGAPLSEDLIIRLSNFFRYSLESDEKMVSLGREIELLQDYIELQETRYSGRIHTEIRIEPGLERVTVPKFILQPLVENSMLHGLKECISDGEIRVRARRVGADVVITVTDNGCGFDTRHPHTGNGKRRSVGMANIAERMELKMRPALIFMDIEMPRKTGLEAAAILHEQLPDTHIVFLTAYDRFDYAVGALRTGGREYLLKPVSETTLRETLRKFFHVEHEPEKDASPFETSLRVWIAQHYTEDITLDDAAESMGMSTFYFSRQVKVLTGHTFLEYLTYRNQVKDEGK